MSTLFNFSLLPKGDCRETGSFSPSHHGEGRVGARRLPLAICAIFLLGLAACKTDVDVNAPATERAVVYALLDPGATTHIVRVERAFLNAAEPDVYKIVKNKDSVYYPTSERSRIQVTLIELLASGAPSQRRAHPAARYHHQ